MFDAQALRTIGIRQEIHGERSKGRAVQVRHLLTEASSIAYSCSVLVWQCTESSPASWRPLTPFTWLKHGAFAVLLTKL